MTQTTLPRSRGLTIAPGFADAHPGARCKPLGDRLVVRRDPAKEASEGGIILPDTAQNKPQVGYVVSVGPGRLLDTGGRLPMDVKPGDRVLWPAYGGSEITGFRSTTDSEYVVLRMDDVMAILADETV